ncbi:MAG: MOSC domain-containing protein [Pseudomonadota bacterium]
MSELSDGSSKQRISAIYRYPIKGLSGEAHESFKLVANEGMAGDRSIAIARKPNTFDHDNPDGVAKNHFLMLMRDAKLAELDSKITGEDDELILCQDGTELLRAPLRSVDGQQAIEAFFNDFLDEESLSPVLVQFEHYKFTDINRISAEKMNAISLINLASVRALEEAIGQPVDPLRFRANIYFDGRPAWKEFDWLDGSITLGTARANIVMRTGRCAATQVNPATAERDLDIPRLLRKNFGHSDMGVYAEISHSGVVAIGDRITSVADNVPS